MKNKNFIRPHSGHLTPENEKQYDGNDGLKHDNIQPPMTARTGTARSSAYQRDEVQHERLLDEVQQAIIERAI